MVVDLSKPDFAQLVTVVQEHPWFYSESGRHRLVGSALSGLPERRRMIGQIDLSGSPQLAATGLVRFLADYGRASDGQEVLAVLLAEVYPSLSGATRGILDEIAARHSFVLPTLSTYPGSILGAPLLINAPDVEGAFLHTSMILADSADFIGRGWFIEQIADFIAQHTRGYLFLTGDAGLGKTALAAEIARRYQSCAFFFNAAIGLTSPALARRALSAEVITRYGLAYDAVSPQSGDSALFLTRLLGDAATAANRPLLVVIDALDEADAPPPGSNVLLLPDRLPEGVYVFLTARPGGYPLHLAPGTPRHNLTLRQNDPGQQTDIRAFLQRQIAQPPVSALLAAAVPPLSASMFAEHLAQASEGNFMYARYILADLAEGGDTITRSALDRLPRGLAGYYEQMWSHLAQGRSTDWALWHRLQRPTIALLAIAGEAVDASWFAAHTGASQAEVRERVLLPWRRFFRSVGPEAPQRWQILHQSFANFLATRDELDLPTAHRAIAAYYREPPGRWDEHDGYAHRHLARHLHLGGEDEALFSLVADPAWLAAQESYDPSGAALVADFAVAWACAEERDRAALNVGAAPLFLARELYAALATASIHSLAAHLPPAFLASLVRSGQWSAERAVAAARLRPNPQERARALANLVAVVLSERQGDLVREAITNTLATRDKWQARLLAELGALVPSAHRLTLVRAAYEAAEQQADPTERAIVLTKLIAVVPADQQVTLLATILEGLAGIHDADSLREVMLSVVPLLDRSQRQRLQASVETWDNARHRADAQAILALTLTGEERQRAIAAALTEALSLTNVHERARPLTTLVPYLDAEQLAVVQETSPLSPVADQKLWPLFAAILCRQAALGDPDKAMATARNFRDGYLQVQTLEALAVYFGQSGDFVCALTIARELGSAVRHASALVDLLPDLPSNTVQGVIGEVLALARTAPAIYERVAIAGRIAAYLSASQLAELLTLVRSIGDIDDVLRALLALSHLTKSDSSRVLGHALSVVSRLGDAGKRARALAMLTPHLPPEHWPDLLKLIDAFSDPRMRAQATRGLATLLPDEAAPRIRPAMSAQLATIAAELASGDRYFALYHTIHDTPPGLLAEFLATACSLVDAQAYAALESAVAHRYAEGGSHELAIETAQAIADEGVRLVTLARLVSRLPVDLRAGIAADVLDQLDPAADEDRWVHAMEHLYTILSPAQLAIVIRCGRHLRAPAARARLLIDILPFVSRRKRRALSVEAFRAIRRCDPWGQGQLLITLAPHLPFALWQRVIDQSERLPGEATLPSIAAALAPRLPARALHSWWTYARALPAHTRGRANLLAALAVRLPEYERVTAVTEACTAAISEHEVAWNEEALTILVPHLPETLLLEILAQALQSDSAVPRTRVFTVLTPALLRLSLTDRYTAWQLVLHGLAPRQREDCFAALAIFWPLLVSLGGPEAATQCAEALLAVVARWP